MAQPPAPATPDQVDCQRLLQLLDDGKTDEFMGEFDIYSEKDYSSEHTPTRLVIKAVEKDNLEVLVWLSAKWNHEWDALSCWNASRLSKFELLKTLIEKYGFFYDRAVLLECVPTDRTDIFEWVYAHARKDETGDLVFTYEEFTHFDEDTQRLDKPTIGAWSHIYTQVARVASMSPNDLFYLNWLKQKGFTGWDAWAVATLDDPEHCTVPKLERVKDLVNWKAVKARLHPCLKMSDDVKLFLETQVNFPSQ